MMHIFDTSFGINIFYTEKFLRFADSTVCQRNRTKFLINDKIRPLFKFSGNFGKFFIKFSRGASVARNNERGPRLINQNRINLINNSVMVFSLRKIFFVVQQIITQIIKAEFIVGTVSNICLISFSFCSWP